MASGIWHPVSGIWHQVSGIWHPVPGDRQGPTSGPWHPRTGKMPVEFNPAESIRFSCRKSLYFSRLGQERAAQLNAAAKFRRKSLWVKGIGKKNANCCGRLGISESLEDFISICIETTYEDSENSTGGKNSEIAEKPL